MFKTKRSSDSSSEMSINNNSEQESNSFIIQKKKKNKRVLSKQTQFTESSPNMRFSRQEEKKYSHQNLVGYLAMDHDRGCDVVWNVADVSKLKEKQKQSLFEEFEKLKYLKHENINTISEVWLKDETSLVFITDSFFGGSIRQYLYKIGIQKLKVIKSWLKMILHGLDYLHKNGLFFRDLNCGRIYYNNNNGVVSIGDLYAATPLFYELFSEKGDGIFSANCMSPEIIKESQPTEKADVYSLGMVLIEMITIEVPYSDYQVSNKMITQKIVEDIKPKILDRISDDTVKQFILRLIDSDPSKRPGISELINDHFLQINDKEDNRKIKLIKLKRKTKKQKLDIEMADKENKKKRLNTKKVVPFKCDFEECPYYEEPPKFFFDKKNKRTILPGESGQTNESNVQSIGKNEIRVKKSLKNNDVKNPLRKNKDTVSNNSLKKESTINTQNVVTSSHEGGTISKYYSDVYHTANTDHVNPQKVKDPGNKDSKNLKKGLNEKVASESTHKSANDNKQDTMIHLSNNTKQNEHSKPYQIFDSNYNVHVKFFINQDGKLHEIRFTYNLIRDSISDLMEEIQNEFNFSHENLNHIYETLKKISIYSKFYKKSDILHDNSA